MSLNLAQQISEHDPSQDSVGSPRWGLLRRTLRVLLAMTIRATVIARNSAEQSDEAIPETDPVLENRR